jgi:hypothetical protein
MDLLFAYLLELAAAPDGKHQSTHEVTWARRGEFVVKGTCHISTTRWGPPQRFGAAERGGPVIGSGHEHEIVARVRAQGP